jgi:hypothetical protein
MNNIQTSAVAALTIMACLGIPCPVNAQVAAEERPFAVLFQAAVKAEGQRYHSLREQIVQRAEEAMPFLNEQSKSADLDARVTARAMLSWIEDPEKNRERTMVMREIVVRSFRYKVQPAIDIFLGRPDGDMVKPIRELLLDESAVPWLAEVALKGLSEPSEEEWEGIGRRGIPGWAREFKAVQWGGVVGVACLIGHHTDADVIPVLLRLLDNRSELMRSYAIGGLLRTRSPEAVEPIINALGDESQKVRHRAYLALRVLTGQEFRKDPGRPLRVDEIDHTTQRQFLEWWQENRERWALRRLERPQWPPGFKRRPGL